MLEELKNYENLGSPEYFWELFTKMNKSEASWTSENATEHFLNTIIGGYSTFDGCLPFASSLGLINIDSNGLITIDPDIQPCLVSERYLTNKILERIFIAFKDDEVLQQIFCSENVSYDIIYHSIQVSGSAFGFRFANFKYLLISFGFLTPHPDTNIRKFIISSSYKKLFDKQILPTIKQRKLGIDELKSTMEQKQINGDEAEIYVLEYEKHRLVNHTSLQKVERISQYDVAAGYDIVSFNELSSMENDRYIEVKSYSGTPYFFWSRNEMDVARQKKENYYLYLVDRAKIIDDEYEPIIIQNPYSEVLENPAKWSKRVESYYIISA